MLLLLLLLLDATRRRPVLRGVPPSTGSPPATDDFGDMLSGSVTTMRFIMEAGASMMATRSLSRVMMAPSKPSRLRSRICRPSRSAMSSRRLYSEERIGRSSLYLVVGW